MFLLAHSFLASVVIIVIKKYNTNATESIMYLRILIMGERRISIQVCVYMWYSSSLLSMVNDYDKLVDYGKLWTKSMSHFCCLNHLIVFGI